MTLPLELGLEAVVAASVVVTVALGGETVVPAATDVTTLGVFVVDVTLGRDVDETTTGVTAVVAPPDGVSRGTLKAGQPSSNSFKTRQKRISRKR